MGNISFNENLIQKIDRSRLVDSRIVEPLKFNERDKSKSLRFDE
jgi:hypothetical protein